jgi:mono/diheme cytochrome c family protein
MPKPQLAKAKNAELLAALASPNGWWRDTAQRLLAERTDINTVPQLKEILKSNSSELARIHALWTLEGMRRLDPAAVRIALADKHPHVRAMGIRAAEAVLASPRRPEILPDILKLAGDMNPTVRLQLALTISEVGLPAADEALARVLDDGKNAYIRDAAVTGLRGRELEFLQRLLASTEWKNASPGREDVFTALARAVTSEANPKRVNALLDAIAQQSGPAHWRQQPLLEGIAFVASGLPARRPIMLTAQPAALVTLEKSKDAAVTKELDRAQKILVWPGKPGYVPPPPVPPLTPSQKERFLAGEKVYGTVCVQCHKPDGMGLAGLAPPLVGSEWALGPEERCIRIVLNGVRGPITVNGEGFNLEMPNLATLSDDQIAGALTFVRRSWDNDGSPIEPETVAKIRKETHARAEQWTERELLRVAAAPPPGSQRGRGAGAPNAERSTTQKAGPSTRPTRPVAVESLSPTPPPSPTRAPARSGGS